MLPDSHPLAPAQAFLLHWFEKAPPDQYVEFYCIASDHMKRPGLAKNVCHVVSVEALEKMFDLQVAAWVQARNAEGYGVYYGAAPRKVVNRTKEGLPTHAREEDVSIFTGVWVDIDKPHWRTVLRYDKPPVTFLNATGNGCHLLFRFAEPILAAKGVEINQQLMARYGGDHCFDAPRVLRLPGTINWKDGTGKVMCKLEFADVERDFSGVIPPEGTISKEAVAALAISDHNKQGKSDKPDGAINYAIIFGRLDADTANVIMKGAEEARKIWKGVQGRKNDNSKADRSVACHIVAKRMYIKGCSDEEVKAVLRNPEFKISEKVQEKIKNEGEKGAEYWLELTCRKASAEAISERNRHDPVGPECNFEPPEVLSRAPQLQFAVERILPVGGFCIVSGAAKAGKSLAVTDLMLLLAGAEGKFFGEFKVNFPGAVGYAQAEITRSSLKNRLQTIGASRGLLWEELPIYVFTGRVNLMEDRSVGQLVKGLKRWNAKYFILDPLARFHYGNENQHGDMMKVLTNVERVASEVGLMGTVIVHHHGKPAAEGGEKHGVQMMRGSTVIGDWGNAHVILQKQWTQSSGKKFVRVSMELRDAEEIPPLSLTLDHNLRHMPYSESEERMALALGLIESHPDAEPAVVINKLVEQGKMRRQAASDLFKAAQNKKKYETPKGEAGSPPPAPAGASKPEDAHQCESGCVEDPSSCPLNDQGNVGAPWPGVEGGDWSEEGPQSEEVGPEADTPPDTQEPAEPAGDAPVGDDNPLPVE